MMKMPERSKRIPVRSIDVFLSLSDWYWPSSNEINGLIHVHVNLQAPVWATIHAMFLRQRYQMRYCVWENLWPQKQRYRTEPDPSVGEGLWSGPRAVPLHSLLAPR